MKLINYTYSILRYTHDVISGECLNVGVILFSPSEGFVRARLQHQFSRLSKAFSGFNGYYYRKLASHIENRISLLNRKPELPFRDRLVDAKTIANLVLPDDDSSLRFSEPKCGVTDDLELTLDQLFERFVIRGQVRETTEPRGHEDVWKTFRGQLVDRDVYSVLKPVTIKGGEFDYEFQHAWKNHKWHCLEALSMDAKEPDYLRERAVRWVGRATDLESDDNLGTLTLLLGKPELERFQTAYIKAKNLLHKMPVKHELVEEQDAEDFALRLADMVRSQRAE